MNSLQDIIAQLTALPPDQLAAVNRETTAAPALQGMRWVPNPGPQTDAYYSKADVLLYGGEPGGGKSQLLLGLAYNAHKRSTIWRRSYSAIGPLTDAMLKIHGSRDGYNGSAPPILNLPDGHQIKFCAADKVGDEQKQMGDGRDLIGFDEATHFAQSQIRFAMGWLRTDDPRQRTRVVLATNPPLTAEGYWITKMFAPWLDDRFPNPAIPGELRWCVSDADGKQTWVETSAPVMLMINSELRAVRPKSYTYIPASVADNPNYAMSDYQRELDAMEEPVRSILLGGFKTVLRDQERQVIPSQWIREAQARWTPKPDPLVPMCALYADVAQGGVADTVLSIRHDGWYAPLIRRPGKDTPNGRIVAGMFIEQRRDNADCGIDLGGGYGGEAYGILKDNFGSSVVHGHKGAEATTARTREGTMGFVNKRSAVYWKFREALDPSQPGGSPIALPDDPLLMADLTAPCFEITPRGYAITPKEKLEEDLGRSLDSGDAVVGCWSIGPRGLTHGKIWHTSEEHAIRRPDNSGANYGPRRPSGMRRH